MQTVHRFNFEKMEVGIGVWYGERESEKGLWESSVKILEAGV
jgi:hypothetical protein